MIVKKIPFGDFIMSIDKLDNFSNAFFNGRKTLLNEFDEVCSKIDEIMPSKHGRQNKEGVIGAGKRVWYTLSSSDIYKLEKLSKEMNEQ
jgi:hypothetical protein